ncbi:RNase adapter RapZ [Marilutibacter spongiae]|uniref:RNase adapter RapZ n=1 Tax=Marilutibacter spongiae TaxID=2025720 RepID=A0A7W3TKZ9_9GAMM|nr:RNase adapter RapZ [Lysobacter spongiae]MBB1060237.1 RNase adapter RapZ [Lysobacter spongiae]
MDSPPPGNAGGNGNPALVIVSGMSGSGKSVALKTLEDLGYYCVDNLPADLLASFVKSVKNDDGAPPKLAVAIDVRNRHNDLSHMANWLAEVGRLGFDPRLVYFESRDDVLLRRYADTRRRHPLSRLGLSLGDAIALERQVSRPLRRLADTVVDTSEMNVHQLRRHIITEFGLGSDNTVSLLFESFAYRHGVPADADFVFDARGLPNPHWDASLRPLSGRDGAIREYLEQQPEVMQYVGQVGEFLDTWLPRMTRDTTRSYVTVAFGCSGGRHRSVYLAEKMGERARAGGWDEVAVHHRELD